MINNPIRKIYQEKNALLDEWLTTSGQQKLKILVRLMDIDDELAKMDKGGDAYELPSYISTFRAARCDNVR